VTLLKYFSHPSSSYFFPTPPIKLKLGLQIGGGLLKANHHLDQSGYLAKQKQGAVHKYDLTVVIRLFQLAGQLHFFSITALSSGSTGFHC
jgi:hypothetical protein